MKQVYLLWFTHTYDDLRDDEMLIGVYDSLESAEAARTRVGQAKGFCDKPEGFEISSYVLNKDHWTSGYIVD